MSSNLDNSDRPRLPAPPDAAQESSIELVARIQAGDRDSLDTLYLRYRDRLLLSIRCRLGPRLRERLESEDILQSVFRDVIADIEHFEQRGPSSLNRYLHACVLNKIRRRAEYYAAAKRTGEVPLSESLVERIADGTRGEPAYANADRFERLERALARLPDDMREVVILRRVEELSNRESAHVIGKTPEATSKLYNRALARLAVSMRTEIA